jgi:hypothetical protein
MGLGNAQAGCPNAAFETGEPAIAIVSLIPP